VKRTTRLAAALVAATLGGLLGAGLGDSRRQGDASSGVAALPATPAPALHIDKAEPLSSQRFVTRWTVVRRAAPAYTAPSPRAPVVAEVKGYAPEGTPNLVPVLGTEARSDGLWVKVRLPALPNGSTGWVRRRSLGPYESVNTHLVVDRARLRATLSRAGKIVFGAPVGIGTDASPTPAGDFNVRSKLTRYASPFYGPIAFGTTARSDVLTDWPGGGFVGIHGTNEPQLLPGRVSHGCIRLRNRDILRLAQLMPVGTRITIR
jgi:lipoprotein-anchoring transpeptidase ErfK/SrfK